MKPPADCKYTPFEAFLRAIPVNQIELTLSFAQIEAVMHSPLPKSAYERMTWWNNEIQSGLSHKNAWLNAGWNVEAADLAGQSVRFARFRFESSEGPIVLHWGGTGGTPDLEADKISLVANEVIRLKIRHDPKLPAWRASLPPHARQVFDLLLEEDATPELIELAQEAPDDEWEHVQFLRVLGGGNPDSAVALMLTNFVLHDIQYEVEISK